MPEHTISVKTYVLVWAALIVLTAATTGIAFLDLGRFNAVVALGIAVVKMLLVALFFMHVLYSTKLTKVVVVGGLFWLALLIFLTLSDFLTRGWLPFPGK